MKNRVKAGRALIVAIWLCVLQAGSLPGAPARQPVREEWLLAGGGPSRPLFARWSSGTNLGVSYHIGRRQFYQFNWYVADCHQSSISYVMNTFGLGIGKRITTPLHLLAVFAGPTINFGKAKNPPHPTLLDDWSETRGLGFFASAQANARLPFYSEIGAGIELYTNFNRAVNNYGLRFVLFLNNGVY